MYYQDDYQGDFHDSVNGIDVYDGSTCTLSDAMNEASSRDSMITVNRGPDWRQPCVVTVHTLASSTIQGRKSQFLISGRMPCPPGCADLHSICKCRF
jgi:hypothetical protein